MLRRLSAHDAPMKTNERFKQIRATLKHKCNLALLDFLATFKTQRKVTIDGQQFMNFIGSTEKDTMYLPLGTRGILDAAIRVSDEMREFYSAFDGLRERKPPTTGHFVPCAQIHALRETLERDDFPGVQKYADCPII